MIPASKPLRPCIALALLFFIVSVDEGWAKTARPSVHPTVTAENSEPSDAALDLAGQVAEIAHSSAISRAKKEKRISTAVRIAVVAATAYNNNPEKVLSTALELTGAAAGAAPQFAEVIANAVSFAPSLARIDSASGQIRTAAYAAAKNPKGGRRANIAATRPRKSSPPSGDSPETSPVQHTTRSMPRDEAESPAPDVVADSTLPEQPATASKVSLEKNSSVNVTANLSVQRDDNVYLTSTDKVSDTIIALTPGVEFAFGQNSLAHGSLSYKNSLTHYVDKSSPNVALSNAAADFGYDSGSLKVLGNAIFQQLNQNDSNVAALGQRTILRRDILGLNSSVESQVTAKTSILTGINYNKSEYKTGGLIGDQETEVPLKFFLETTPKLSMFTGVAYRWVNPINGGAKGKDLDYNIGARGNFTAKLSGEMSLDYRTRRVGSNPMEKLWGVNGTLNYEVTPKTTSALVISNDFNTGALGESLKNSSYALRFSSDPAPQWQFGAGLTHRRVQYGQSVFRLNNVPTLVDRTDQSWEGDLQGTYLFSSWLSATVNYTLRHNSSSLAAAEYNNSILSLILGWRY